MGRIAFWRPIRVTRLASPVPGEDRASVATAFTIALATGERRTRQALRRRKPRERPRRPDERFSGESVAKQSPGTGTRPRVPGRQSDGRACQPVAGAAQRWVRCWRLLGC